MSNFCKDCGHCEAKGDEFSTVISENAQCMHPENHRLATSYVTGAQIDAWTGSPWCADERLFGAACGPEGTRFEPK